MRVALGLQINFPIRIFTSLKYEKHSITPEPKPPQGHLYHGAEVYKTKEFSYDCFKVYLLHELIVPEIVLTNLYDHRQTEIDFDKTSLLMEENLGRRALYVNKILHLYCYEIIFGILIFLFSGLGFWR